MGNKLRVNVHFNISFNAVSFLLQPVASSKYRFYIWLERNHSKKSFDFLKNLKDFWNLEVHEVFKSIALKALKGETETRMFKRRYWLGRNQIANSLSGELFSYSAIIWSLEGRSGPFSSVNFTKHLLLELQVLSKITEFWSMAWSKLNFSCP